MTDKKIEIPQIKFCAIAGDPQTFNNQYAEFSKKNTILKEAISSQVMQIQNPLFGTGVGQPREIQSIVISAVIWYNAIDGIPSESPIKLIN
jgi:hypothetical protein